jgi:hypothetical protein
MENLIFLCAVMHGNGIPLWTICVIDNKPKILNLKSKSSIVCFYRDNEIRRVTSRKIELENVGCAKKRRMMTLSWFAHIAVTI